MIDCLFDGGSPARHYGRKGGTGAAYLDRGFETLSSLHRLILNIKVMNRVQFDYIMSSLEAQYLAQTTEVDAQISIKKNEMLELHTLHDTKINELKAEILGLENKRRAIKLAWATDRNKVMTDFVELEEGDQIAES